MMLLFSLPWHLRYIVTSVTSPGPECKYVLKCDNFLTLSICVVMASVAGSWSDFIFPPQLCYRTLCHLNDKCEGCCLAFLTDYDSLRRLRVLKVNSFCSTFNVSMENPTFQLCAYNAGSAGFNFKPDPIPSSLLLLNLIIMDLLKPVVSCQKILPVSSQCESPTYWSPWHLILISSANDLMCSWREHSRSFPLLCCVAYVNMFDLDKLKPWTQALC